MDEGTMKHSFRSSGHPNVPDHLRLKQVIVICRHGDRAPVASRLGTLLQEGPEAKAIWMSKLPSMDDIERWKEAFPQRTMGGPGEAPSQRLRGVRADDRPFGQLTRRGAEELRMMGASLGAMMEGDGLRKALFPRGIEVEKSSIFVRCTYIVRTHQSAQNMLMGMGLRGGVDLFVRPSEKETMYPNARHGGARQSELIAKAMEENHWPGQPELAHRTAEVCGIDEQSIKWTTAREVLTCFEAHGVPLPPGVLSSGFVDKVVDYTGWMWGTWFNNREMARLSLGPFIAEVLEVMGLRGDTPGVPGAGISRKPKLAIFSGHDSTLVPFLCALRLYHGSWPSYASYLTLEVAEDGSGQELVRVVYNGEEVTLPGAPGPWIPAADFQLRLEDVMPLPEDYATPSQPDEAAKSGTAEISSAVGGKANGR